MHLIITDEIHIPACGTYITSPVVSAGFAKVLLKTKVEGIKAETSSLRLATEIKDAAGKTVSAFSSVLLATDDGQFEQQLIVNTPALRSPETPNL
ncbi:hypothetical protein [Pedobacter hartonius]|uniref:hypothetical protein n=1 Tax=Pedobacter hartonius TaxID=425514 RepID=UPI001C31A2D9|nr:hypothetical protein [Pedobacter hartonius]